jgi:hypothetical protein
MKHNKFAVCALALAAATAVLPTVASARSYHHRNYYYSHHHRYYSRTDNGCRSRHARNGAIVGAVGGGVVANSLARGNRLPGTLLGAGVGALAGHEIGRGTGC